MNLLRSFVFLALALSLTSCARSRGLSGTYTASGHGTFQSLTFTPDGKVMIASGNDTIREGTYLIDGTSVKIMLKEKTEVLAIDANGCLDGGTLLGMYCRGAGAAAISDQRSATHESATPPRTTNANIPSAGAALAPQPLATEPAVTDTTPRSAPPAATGAAVLPSDFLLHTSFVATAGKGVSLTLEFLADHKVRMTVAGGGPTAVQEGTYKINGDHVTITIQGDAAEFSRTDDGLEGKLDNAVVKFTKR
jgi:hypothetical protein